MKLKLRSVGTSTGVLLPKEMLVRLKVKRTTVFLLWKHPKAICLPHTTPKLNGN